MTHNKVNDLYIENARIGMKNFAGIEKKYNAKGNRNFAVFLDRDLAEKLQKDGWKVKWLRAREEGQEDQAFLKVTVSYKLYPPKIIRVSGNIKTALSEELIDSLDNERIISCDLILSPYYWNMGGDSGLKAYLKTMYVNVEPDPFESKYYFDDSNEDDNLPF